VIAAFALLMATSTPIPDQSSDLVLVSKFVEALKKGADGRAKAMLTAGAFVGDYHEKDRTTFAEFASYARECRVREVTIALHSERYPRGPIGVEWRCTGLEASRHASFWFEGNQIRRIGWGPLMVIKTPSVEGAR